jgi:hypothetical protein
LQAFDELFWKNQKQIWTLHQTNILMKAKNWNVSFDINEEAGEAEFHSAILIMLMTHFLWTL